MATHTNQNQLIVPPKGEIILYQTADGRTSVDVKLENETVWLSSEQMALLFERDRTVIQRHIRNIYSEGELIRDTTSAKFAHMGKDGDQTYVTELFNLEVDHSTASWPISSLLRGRSNWQQPAARRKHFVWNHRHGHIPFLPWRYIP